MAKRRGPQGVGAQRTELIPPLAFRAEVRPDSLDEESRSVEVVFSTGAPVERYNWLTDQRYVETLSMKPSDVRLDRLNAGAPFLDSHSAFRLANVIGTVEDASARIAGGQGVARVRISKRAEVEPIWQDIRDRIVRNVSVGYRVHRYVQTEASEGKPMTRHAVDWEPYEISAVPMPADAGAQIRAEDTTQTTRCVIDAHAMEERIMPDERPQPEPEPQPQPTDPGAPTAPALTQGEHRLAETEHQAGISTERERASSILQAARIVHLPPEFAEELVRDGLSLVQAQAAIIEAVSKRASSDLGPRPGGTGITITREHNAHVREGIENALLHRVAPQWFALDEKGRLYANRRMIGLAEIWLQSNGKRTTAMGSLEIAGEALGLNARTGYHTTSDFVFILADVMGKTLRAAYGEAPQTFGPITTNKDLVDFKPVKRVQLSEAPGLLLVNEHGEFTSGTMGDAREQYQLKTYGRTFPITRQALINDDTEAFSDMAIRFARQARNKESDLAWAEITSNPLMGDGVALFHATHGNLAAAGAAIDITTIGAGWTAMGMQVGLAVAGNPAEYLNLTPAYLIVPKGKETLARQFVSVNMQATAPANINPFAGVLTVIADPRLDAASAVSWYLATTPAQVQMIEMGFLSGQSGPMVESQIGFKIDGIEIKCRHDVAAKVIDWRGLYKNPGA